MGAAPGMGAGTGGQNRAQGSDTFGNPQAPQSGAAVYNADGQAVGIGDTSITPGQTVSTSHHHSGMGGGHVGTDGGRTGSGSGYSSGNTGAGSGYSGGNSGRDTGSGPSLASVVPGTQAYKEAHLRDGGDGGMGHQQHDHRHHHQQGGSGSDYSNNASGVHHIPPVSLA